MEKEGFHFGSFEIVAKSMNIKNPSRIIKEVREAVGNWRIYAEGSQCRPKRKKGIAYELEQLAAQFVNQ